MPEMMNSGFIDDIQSGIDNSMDVNKMKFALESVVGGVHAIRRHLKRWRLFVLEFMFSKKLVFIFAHLQQIMNCLVQ